MRAPLPTLPRAARALAAAALALSLACAGARPRPDGDDREPVVRSLRILGTRALSEDDVARRLATAPTGRWPWSRTRRFDPVLWEEDLRRVERVYEAQGYYGTRVVGAEVARRADGVHLAIRVEEVPLTRIASVAVVGLDGLPEGAAKAARGAVRLREGAPFREADWVATKAGLARALRDHGYAQAAAGGTARVDVGRRAADVRVEVAPGERYRLGPLYVAAEPRPAFPMGAVLAHARALLPEGTWFSQQALQDAQLRLYGLGIFTAVAVTAAPAPEGADRLPVVVEVREAPLVSARAGGGVGVDPARSEVRALAEWTHRSFGGDLRVLRAAARAGWAFLPTPWDALAGSGPDPRRQGPFARASLDLAQPGLAGAPSLEGFAALELERDLREAYAFDAARLEVGVGWHLRQEVDARASWALDLWGLRDTALVARPGPGAPEGAFGCTSPCRLAYLEQELTVGRRYGYRDPPKGRELTLRLREGAPALGGTFAWVEAGLDGRGYWPLSPRWVLAARASAGTLVPLRSGPAPIVERLFSGGSAMRGYGDRRLSPLLALRRGGRLELAPVGGKGLLEGSVELRADLASGFAVGAFVDAGAVSVQPFDPARLGRALHVAPGAGVRYRTALGPIRADVAALLPWGPALPVAVQPGSGIDPAAARAAAGRGRACCAMHISLGEAF